MVKTYEPAAEVAELAAEAALEVAPPAALEADSAMEAALDEAEATADEPEPTLYRTETLISQPDPLAARDPMRARLTERRRHRYRKPSSSSCQTSRP